MDCQIWWFAFATLIALATGHRFLTKGVLWAGLPLFKKSQKSQNNQSGRRTYRVRGIPAETNVTELEARLNQIFRHSVGEVKRFTIKSLANAASSQRLVATLDFDRAPAVFQDEAKNQWTLTQGYIGSLKHNHSLNLSIDNHFQGLTPLHTAPKSDQHANRIDVIAVNGLGGHAFGSFKERGGTFMWLRDALGEVLPTANIWTYGFDSTVYNSKSTQTIDDLASGLVSSLREVVDSVSQHAETGPASTMPRRLVFIGHSLGGLIIKQALIRLNQQRPSDADILRLVNGLLFFGVPNQGMPFRSLLTMSGGGPNEHLLQSLGPESEILRVQQEQFTRCAALMKCKIHCFYETMLSPTVARDDKGQWKLNGPNEYLVTRESATNCLEGIGLDVESHAVNASHSELVKFKQHDHTAEPVFRILVNICTGESRSAISSPMHHIGPSSAASYEFGLQITQAPYLEQSLFRGRAKELESLAENLLPHKGNSSQRIISLSGLGGIGKTQLALAFARKYQRYFTTVIWLDCQTEGSLLSDIDAFVAHMIAFGNKYDAPHSNQNQEQIIKFRSWLSEPNNQKWLMILDNYDRPLIGSKSSSEDFDVKKYFPWKSQGSILITTRSTRLPYRAMPHLQKLSTEDSQDLLLQRSERNLEVEDSESLERLVSRLGGLPLALATAADYLRQAPISISKYLEIYNHSWKDLSSARLSDYENRTLRNTWNLSLQLISPQAVHLLQFLAYFENHDLWFELLSKATEMDKSSRLSSVLESEISFLQNMRLLQDFALVESNQSEGNYSLHSCVHDWALHHLNVAIDHNLYRMAFRCVSETKIASDLPLSTIENNRVYPHLKRLLHSPFRHVLEENPNIIERKDYHAAGILLHERDELDDSEIMLTLALQKSEIKTDPPDESTLEIMNSLASLYAQQGRLEKAEQMATRALQGYEKALGPDDLSTLDIVQNVGALYAEQGKLVISEQMYARALLGFEKVLSPNHERVLRAVDQIGITYLELGKLEQAEQMHLRALQGFEELLSPDDPSIHRVYQNLGNLYCETDRLEEAEKMYLRALKGFETALGRDHTLTLSTVNNLGTLFSEQGKYGEAEEMYTRVLQGREKVLGPGNISTLRVKNNLGNLYCDQIKYKEAEQMYIEALQGYEEALDPDHASTLLTANNLGTLYVDLNQLEKAEQMYMRSLRGYEKTLGCDHKSTLMTLNNLGTLYIHQSMPKEAEQIYMRVLKSFENSSNLDHTFSIDTTNNLGNLYLEQGKIDEAEELYMRGLQVSERVLGDSHHKTLITLNNLAVLHYRTGATLHAEELYLQGLQEKEKELGASHVSTLVTVNNLGVLYETQGKLDSACKAYTRALQGFEQVFGPDHPTTKKAKKNLSLSDEGHTILEFR